MGFGIFLKELKTDNFFDDDVHDCHVSFACKLVKEIVSAYVFINHGLAYLWTPEVINATTKLMNDKVNVEEHKQFAIKHTFPICCNQSYKVAR